MKKILFLDIDGVLSIPDFNIGWELNISKQKLLGKIIEKTNCDIVLSSSWRKNTLEETKNYMTLKGFLFSDKIIGITIRAYHYIDTKEKIHLSIPRGVEIKQWLDTNIHSNNGKDYKFLESGIDYTYCIVDDDDDMLLEHQNNFIKTNSEKGLTQKNAIKIINILNNNTI